MLVSFGVKLSPRLLRAPLGIEYWKSRLQIVYHFLAGPGQVSGTVLCLKNERVGFSPGSHSSQRLVLLEEHIAKKLLGCRTTNEPPGKIICS